MCNCQWNCRTVVKLLALICLASAWQRLAGWAGSSRRVPVSGRLADPGVRGTTARLPVAVGYGDHLEEGAEQAPAGAWRGWGAMSRGAGSPP